jgi:hypothetical protein
MDTAFGVTLEGIIHCKWHAENEIRMGTGAMENRCNKTKVSEEFATK